MNENIYEELLKLSVHEKLELISELWDSITGDSYNVNLPKGHREILKSRLENFDKETEEAKSWEEIRSKYL